MTRSMTRLVQMAALAGFFALSSVVLPAAPAAPTAPGSGLYDACEESCTDGYNSCVGDCTTLKCAALCERRLNQCMGRC